MMLLVVTSSVVAEYLELAEKKHTVALLLESRKQFVQQHQLARVLDEVILREKEQKERERGIRKGKKCEGRNIHNKLQGCGGQQISYMDVFKNRASSNQNSVRILRSYSTKPL